MPAVLVVVWAERHGFVSTAGEALENQAALTRAGGRGLDGLRHAYPPIPTFLAILLPGGALGVAVVAALLAGASLHALVERLVLRGVPWPLIAVMTSAVVLAPAVWFQVIDGIGTFMALIFLVLALDGYLRFTVRDDTLGGFRTGTMLALAFLCDPLALVYGVVLVAAAPQLAPKAYRAEPGAIRAIACVLLFPTIAALFSWSFLLGYFGDSPVSWLTSAGDPGDLLPQRGVGLADALRDVAEVLIRSPLYLVVAVLLATRNRRGVVGYLLPVPVLVLVGAVGVAIPSALTFSLLGVLALLTAPRDPSGRVTGVLIAAAAVQAVVAIGWIPDGSELHTFWSVVR